MNTTHVAAGLLFGTLAAGCSGDGVRVGEEGAGGSSGSGGGAACATNQECLARFKSESHICRKDDNGGGQCVNLVSAECPKLLADPGDLLRDDALVVGVLGAPSATHELLQAENALELARREFQATAGGAVAGGGARPVVWVSCDASLTSDAEYKSAADHLFDEVRVPAVVLTTPITNWAFYLHERAGERGTVVVNASGVDFVSHQGFFFSNSPTPTDEARAEAAFVAVIEANARAEGQGGELKLAYLRSDAAAEQAAAFNASVRVNGKSVVDNGANYREISYGDGLDAAKVAAAVADAVAFAPHLVACNGVECGKIVAQIEAAGPGLRHYVLPASGLLTARGAAGASEAFRKHLLGVALGPGPSDARSAEFKARFSTNFFDSQAASTLALHAYDAAYALTFALGAAGMPPRGPALMQAFSGRFRADGAALDVGAASILRGNSILATGGTLNLRGVANDVVFDERGGLASYEALAFCVQAGAEAVAETGLRYTPTAGVRGTNGCF